jgi:hypothetical protein
MVGAVCAVTLVWLKHMQGHSERLRADAGIAIGPILFIIAILGVLAAAIAAGSGAFTSDTSSESAKAMAGAIVQQGVNVQNAVALVMGRGCSDTQLNFANAVDNMAANPLSPSDHSCDIYHPAGGNLTQAVFYSAVDATKAAALLAFDSTSAPGMLAPNAGQDVSGIGTTGNSTASIDLLLVAHALRTDVCIQINRMVGYNPPTYAPPTHLYWSITGFNGTYSVGSSGNLGFGSGIMQGCFIRNGAPYENNYVVVLVPR